MFLRFVVMELPLVEIFLEFRVVSLFEVKEAVDRSPSFVLFVELVGFPEIFHQLCNSRFAIWVLVPICRDSARALWQEDGMDAFELIFDTSVEVEPFNFQCFGSLEGVALKSRHDGRTYLIFVGSCEF